MEIYSFYPMENWEIVDSAPPDAFGRILYKIRIGTYQAADGQIFRITQVICQEVFNRIRKNFYNITFNLNTYHPLNIFLFEGSVLINPLTGNPVK